MDVVGVALQPGGVEEDVLAALLHRALGRRRRVAVEEALRANTGEVNQMKEMGGFFGKKRKKRASSSG